MVTAILTLMALLAVVGYGFLAMTAQTTQVSKHIQAERLVMEKANQVFEDLIRHSVVQADGILVPPDSGVGDTLPASVTSRLTNPNALVRYCGANMSADPLPSGETRSTLTNRAGATTGYFLLLLEDVSGQTINCANLLDGQADPYGRKVYALSVSMAKQGAFSRQQGGFWKEPVATKAQLDTMAGSVDGEIRVVAETSQAWRWDKAQGLWVTVSGSNVVTSAPSGTPTCPAKWIAVPETNLPDGKRVKGFCTTSGAVGRTNFGGEMSSGYVTATYEYHSNWSGSWNTPLVVPSQTFQDSKNSCSAIGGRLIRNEEYDALVYQLYQNGKNWTSGTVGSGTFFTGNTTAPGGEVNNSQCNRTAYTAGQHGACLGPTVLTGLGNSWETWVDVEQPVTSVDITLSPDTVEASPFKVYQQATRFDPATQYVGGTSTTVNLTSYSGLAGLAFPGNVPVVRYAGSVSVENDYFYVTVFDNNNHGNNVLADTFRGKTPRESMDLATAYVNGLYPSFNWYYAGAYAGHSAAYHGPGYFPQTCETQRETTPYKYCDQYTGATLESKVGFPHVKRQSTTATFINYGSSGYWTSPSSNSLIGVPAPYNPNNWADRFRRVEFIFNYKKHSYLGLYDPLPDLGAYVYTYTAGWLNHWPIYDYKAKVKGAAPMNALVRGTPLNGSDPSLAHVRSVNQAFPAYARCVKDPT